MKNFPVILLHTYSRSNKIIGHIAAFDNKRIAVLRFIWNDANRKLIIQPKSSDSIRKGQRMLRIELVPQMITKEVLYNGNRIEVVL